MDRPFSKGSNSEMVPLGEASHGRTFSVKKLNKITSFYNSKLQVGNTSVNQLMDRKSIKNG